MGQIQLVTDDNFQAEVLNAPELVLVDFWAVWCGPCQLRTPDLEKLVDRIAPNEYQRQRGISKHKIVRVDIDKCPKTVDKYNVPSVPAALYFSLGIEVGRYIGGCSVATLRNSIADHQRFGPRYKFPGLWKGTYSPLFPHPNQPENKKKSR